MPRADIWAAIHHERAALADELADLTPQQWSAPSLCGRWSVQEVVAHLTAAASTGRLRWIRSMLGARFDADLHNQRRMREHLGTGPAETLERFRATVTKTTAPSGHTPAWLGEIVVHGTDIRYPLGLTGAPALSSVTEVACFFAARDFTVSGRTATTGLHLQATDGPFDTGAGPSVRGSTLALVMAMAGRTGHCAELSGPGVATLHERIDT
ncbi:maleylpyruvate isomerase family mycothiol-dependent enzyme [Nocardia zapadnayensis]|uniref:maleylpyruvate isomerase family mycothiol-dependent enzyme n=1 Tax=Nocardia rhamnosiphila TaxID=426716 RepID=UPI00224547FA|nr:maleylpyruvate isomerase family mycothiol-dependent enzyme [Nocardia zapadnayensis]MCX0274285.1 maleylpyruvate isomerase family mycothiol-dependent enzyme [Nocardia zapadnayensis]